VFRVQPEWVTARAGLAHRGQRRDDARVAHRRRVRVARPRIRPYPEAERRRHRRFLLSTLLALAVVVYLTAGVAAALGEIALMLLLLAALGSWERRQTRV
jgi:hypothetical protein